MFALLRSAKYVCQYFCLKEASNYNQNFDIVYVSIHVYAVGNIKDSVTRHYSDSPLVRQPISPTTT